MNFEFHNPTHLNFGVGKLLQLGELAGKCNELFSQHAQDAVLVVHDEDGNLPGRPPLSKDDIITVLTSAL